MRFKRTRGSLLGCAVGLVPFLAGCESGNGDPHSGGIFWSESKAKHRLSDADEDRRRDETDSRQAERRVQEIKAKIRTLQRDVDRKREEARNFDAQGKERERDQANDEARQMEKRIAALKDEAKQLRSVSDAGAVAGRARLT